MSVGIDKYSRVRNYLDLVLAPDPFFAGNGSHRALLALGVRHGRLSISNELDDYFAEFGPNGSKDPFNKHNQGEKP